jgi:intron-binding protein aquarius
LTIGDYLLRNFLLYRLESSFEIREDIADSVKRMGPKLNQMTKAVSFGGWARMSLPIISLSIDEVQIKYCLSFYLIMAMIF